MKLMRFTHQLTPTLSLQLMTPEVTPEVHALTVKNIDRLREWATWAQQEPTYDLSREWVNSRVEAYFRGRAIPCMIYDGHRALGSIELRIDPDRGIGEIGYWLDEDAEGRGIVTRACQSLMDYGETLGLKRFELRIATANDKSSAVAERLGFELEGILRQTTPVQNGRLDTMLYAHIVE